MEINKKIRDKLVRFMNVSYRNGDDGLSRLFRQELFSIYRDIEDKL